MRVLQAQGLPRPVQPGFDALFSETGVLATPSEDRARLIAATAGELARSLEQLPGVLTARVHVAVPKAQPALDADPAPTTAAVLITRRQTAAALAEEPVRKLVSSAFEGLDPNRVSVVQVAAAAAQAGPAAFVRVGPFTVSRPSAPGLRAALAAALGLDVVFALAVIVLVRQRQRTPPDMDHKARNRPRAR
jgi:type III secretion protein J